MKYKVFEETKMETNREGRIKIFFLLNANRGGGENIKAEIFNLSYLTFTVSCKIKGKSFRLFFYYHHNLINSFFYQKENYFSISFTFLSSYLYTTAFVQECLIVLKRSHCIKKRNKERKKLDDVTENTRLFVGEGSQRFIHFCVKGIFLTLIIKKQLIKCLCFLFFFKLLNKISFQLPFSCLDETILEKYKFCSQLEISKAYFSKYKNVIYNDVILEGGKDH